MTVVKFMVTFSETLIMKLEEEKSTRGFLNIQEVIRMAVIEYFERKGMRNDKVR